MAQPVQAQIVVSQVGNPAPGGYVAGCRDGLTLGNQISCTLLNTAGVNFTNWRVVPLPANAGLSYGIAGLAGATLTLTPPAGTGYGDVAVIATAYGDPLPGGGANVAIAIAILGIRAPNAGYAPGVPLPHPLESNLGGSTTFDAANGRAGREAEAFLALYKIAAGSSASIGVGTPDQVLATAHGGSAVQWTKITDNNVDPAAAVAGSKIVPTFGSQAVTGASFKTTSGIGWTAGLTSVSVASASAGVLALAAGQLEAQVLEVTGSSGGAVTITVPNSAAPCEYLVVNKSTVAIAVKLVTDSGAGVLIPAGQGALVYSEAGAMLGQAFGGGGGGTTPTGTGLRKVVGGVENAAAALLVDADVSATAALAISKLASGANGQVWLTAAGGNSYGQVSSAYVDSTILRADGLNALTGNFAAGGFRLTNVGTPTVGTDAATKAYVDAAIAGLSAKQSVKATHTGALGGAFSYSNGSSGVGATITASANGAFPAQDGVTLGLNDRFLVRNASPSTVPGIYTLTQVGSGAAPWILTRSTDANTPAELGGAFVLVENGTTLGGTGWVIGPDPSTMVIGTSAIQVTQFNATSYSAGALLSLTGSTFAVADAAAGTLLGGTGTGTPAYTANPTVTTLTATTECDAGKFGAPRGGVWSVTTCTVDCSAGGTITLTNLQFNCGRIIMTGALPADTHVELPLNNGGLIEIDNQTTGAFVLDVGAAGGNKVWCPPGDVGTAHTLLQSDASNWTQVNSGFDIQITVDLTAAIGTTDTKILSLPSRILLCQALWRTSTDVSAAGFPHLYVGTASGGQQLLLDNSTSGFAPFSAASSGLFGSQLSQLGADLATDGQKYYPAAGAVWLHDQTTNAVASGKITLSFVGMRR